ncbi:MAG: hypothetical protein Q7I99_06490 [Acholeplasmataceae bacterium]|nr:hypothetical protein [Acholeplasmataceae bacterium]
MDKKIFIKAEDFRRMREHGHGPEHMRRMMKVNMVNEVKLFTEKNKMVDYVNGLSGIENVEIFKIEDNLYKVLVSRRIVEKDCCKEDSKECCKEETKACCEDEPKACCDEEPKECCK